MSETPAVADKTAKRPLPKWLQVVIAVVVIGGALALFYLAEIF